MIKVAVFDFDGTLYKGDSLIDFCLYIYKRYPFRSRFLLLQLVYLVQRKLGLINTKEFKSKFLIFIKGFEESNLKHLVNDFWENRMLIKENKAVGDKLRQLQKEGVIPLIISASPELFLYPIKEYYGVELLGTIIQKTNTKYKIIGENCRSNEKLKRLDSYFQNETWSFEYATSDNYDDKELLALAKESLFIEH